MTAVGPGGFIWMLVIQVQVPGIVQQALDHEHLLHLALYLKSDFTFISFLIMHKHEQSYTVKSLSTGSWVANSARVMPSVCWELRLDIHNESAQLISCSFCLDLFYFFSSQKFWDYWALLNLNINHSLKLCFKLSRILQFYLTQFINMYWPENRPGSSIYIYRYR